MKMTIQHLAQTPLLLRVVFVYVGIFLANHVVHAVEFDFSALSSFAHSNQIQTRATSTVPYKNPNKSMPTALVIEAVKLDLDILPSTYNTTSESQIIGRNTVRFATTSMHPNYHTGTTLLYSRADLPVVEKTQMLAPGDIAVITTSDNREFHYRYITSANILPSNIPVLSKVTKEPRLILITHERQGSEYRKAYYFEIIPKREAI
jgi:hypothetical protein